ncbi:MAG: hypothetical protein B5M51_09240 [Anaerolinea sp. 4484_236]|nr:MAG: hypothetical protein B5M51_09240 [Anaerolinea sp. 4484_236]OQY31062.1 MAG: hypothetical protein B6243_09095 [Anaerolineaceae bacterium 4572_5.2]RLD03223.1 MAG: type II toxin-antitoxin system Phd/YefM family antitoxin [Chloroflexota bacterium]
MTTKVVTAHDMQAQISDLLVLISNGIDVVIEKDDKPFAKLVAIHESDVKRIPGLNKGEIWVSDDFDDPLPDEFWLGRK